MRIAIFTEYYFPFISGVVTHIKALKDELERKGNEVLIVTTDPEAKHHYMKDGVLYCPAKAVKRIYGYGVTYPISMHRLNMIRDFDPDVIHIHTEFSVGLFALWVARKLKKPVVYTLHTMYDDYTFYLFPEKFDRYAKMVTHTYLRNIAKRADEIIGPSLKVVEFLKRCGVDRHVHIIPNITDVTLFLPENVDMDRVGRIKEANGITPEVTTLCFVGRLGKEKSIDVLLDNVARCVADGMDLKLFVIGDGPEKEALEKQASELGLSDRVIFTGKVNHGEIATYYYASDLYATASVTEMNSISMLEAMASGLMVLQRLDIYNKYQITEGKNGWLFSDTRQFKRLLSDYSAKSRREKDRIRQRAVRFSRSYGPEEFVSKVLDVYRIALQKK